MVSTHNSVIFFCNTNIRTKRDILRKVQFCEGSLPVTYLGLPLVTTRLSKSDCAPLLERLMARANSWISKALSFVGRLQLIKATLTSMQVYWCSMFLLPVSIIKDCECVLRNFLWGSHGRGKVKWSSVCKPLKEGGLGIKDLKTWNKALLLKQVWNVLQKQSLWARWCHAYLIKQSNFWSVPSDGLHSWSWRQILLLRPIAKEHLVYRCGRGDKFSLWFNPWMHGETVHALYGHRVIYDAELGRLALVKKVICEGRWCWPQYSRDLIEIQQRVQDIPISLAPDCICWETAGHSFSTNKAWQGIRTRSNEVSWHNLVWFPSRIPKHAFCLAVRVVQTTDCVFHCGEVESLEHIFFQCPYTKNIWTAVLAICNISRPILPWEEEVIWMTDHSRRHSLLATVRKMALAASVYHIWMERNRRSFKNHFLPVFEIIGKIRQDVGWKLLKGGKIQRSERYHSICINWGFFPENAL
ncbi:zf-RVT domain-containing protein [Cephalotus follicularis]|uniref:Zf-RVT domain-containing protein n=1 Tax=Cephalotus follicularis TaxID=3775 RepID=A0A1Q3C1Z4_CEPFO|nr:zf-RVT domain-containing protein [Cephalotus follicularis]